MRVLFLENHDSFSGNVIDRLPVPPGDVTVRDGGEAGRDPGALDGFDAVVLGPGPTDPVRAGLVGLVRDADRRHLPLLGVCLGFQAIGLAYGAALIRTRPAHGLRCTARFEPSRLFPGIVGQETVMRYHSLSLSQVLPPLRVVAWTADGIPMAVEHDHLPIAGVQFHPDSYATPRGIEVFAAFFEATR